MLPRDLRPSTRAQAGRCSADDETSQQAISSFAELAADVDGGAVLGYGTTDGAPMLEFVGTDELFESGDSPYVLDYYDRSSRRSPASTREISSRSPTSSASRTSTAASRAGSARWRRRSPTPRRRSATGRGQTRRRLYWIPALALFAVLLWQAAATTNEALASATSAAFRDTNNAERVSA